MNRLILLVESRIRGDVYVRFGGELPKTHRSNTAGRWMLSLPILGGHTHTFMKEPAIYLNKDGKNVPVMHTGKSGIYVGMLKLTLTEEEAQPSSK